MAFLWLALSALFVATAFADDQGKEDGKKDDQKPIRNPLTELEAIHDEINAVSATPWYHGTACR